MIGDDTRRAIIQTAARVGVSLSDPWAYSRASFSGETGERRLKIRVITPDPLTGLDGAVAVDYIAPFDWAEGHRAYHAEVFGKPIRSKELFDQCPPDVRWGMWFDEDGSAADAIAAWDARAIHPKSTVFAQVDWRPGWPAPEHSYGGVVPGSKNDTTRADLGFRLLADVQRSSNGRPPKSGAIRDEVEFRATFEPIVRALRKRGHPSEEKVIEYVGQNPSVLPRFSRRDRSAPDVRTLRRWVQEHCRLKDWGEFLETVR